MCKEMFKPDISNQLFLLYNDGALLRMRIENKTEKYNKISSVIFKIIKVIITIKIINKF